MHTLTWTARITLTYYIVPFPAIDGHYNLAAGDAYCGTLDQVKAHAALLAKQMDQGPLTWEQWTHGWIGGDVEWTDPWHAIHLGEGVYRLAHHTGFEGTLEQCQAQAAQCAQDQAAQDGLDHLVRQS